MSDVFVIVTTRASISGWLALHKRTRLLVPSGPIRMIAIVLTLLLLPHLGYVSASLLVKYASAQRCVNSVGGNIYHMGVNFSGINFRKSLKQHLFVCNTYKPRYV